MPYVFVISNVVDDDEDGGDDEQDVCIIPVFQRQSESNDVTFVHKRIIFYIV